MNKLLLVSISVLALHQTHGVPVSPQFQTQAYQTHSIYPTYNVHHQTVPLNIFPHSALVPSPSSVNSVHLNSDGQKKLETDYHATFEKFKNEHGDQKVDGKSVELVSPGSVVNSPFLPDKAVSDFDHSKSSFSGLEVTSLDHHHADPIFGPEFGSKYEIHYSPEHLLSLPSFTEYAGYPIHEAFPDPQPVFPSAYTDFSSYPEYPQFGGSNTFLSAASDGSQLLGLNKIDGIQQSIPLIGGSSSSTPEASSQSSSEASYDSTTEGNIGAPPSIDGPKPEKQEVSSQDAVDSSSSNEVSAKKKAVKA